MKNSADARVIIVIRSELLGPGTDRKEHPDSAVFV